MKKKLSNILGIIGVLSVTLSCSDKGQEDSFTSADDIISLSGIGTRANGDTYSGLYLKAVVGEAPAVTYIAETPLDAVQLFTSPPTDLIFTDGSPYYPLGENEIRFFAYSGRLNAGGEMQLTSGRSLSNDAILSNQGFRSGEAALSEPGEGTPGSSTQPATILQFRHVMTRVYVNVEIDDTEDPEVNSIPEVLEFRLNGLRAQGTYPITATPPDNSNPAAATVAGNLSGTYTLQLGDNYVVPTGVDIRTMALEYLKVDDYTATEEDLQNLSINYISGNQQAYLVPGYAYILTFRISRLRVHAIELELTPWELVPVNDPDPISYDDYLLSLELDAYLNNGADSIAKVVLWASDGREYVGSKNPADTTIRFPILPTTGTIDSVALYTGIGKLFAGVPESYTYAAGGSTLDLPLSVGGMKLVNPNLPASENNPYQVTTPVQVFNMEKNLTAHYRQMNDIDVAQLTYTQELPLFGLSIFEGSYDGNGYKVTNLVMTGPALIRRNQGNIYNLHIASGRIDATGESIAGSICAENEGTLVACINEARIINAPATAGGICGLNKTGGRVIGCINTGNIESGTILGGVAGNNEDPNYITFISCINTGLLNKSATTIGGILGNSVSTSEVLIKNSFWLVGTATREFGGLELPVGGNPNIGISDVTSLSPEKLRDLAATNRDLEEVEDTLHLLNEGLDEAGWGAVYEFVLNQNLTGSVWPIPVKRN